MKEFINRRIYNEQRGKGVIQKRLKERLEGKKKKEK